MKIITNVRSVMQGALFLLFGFSMLANANVVPDASFEAGTKNWTLQDSTLAFTGSPVHSGSRALKMINTGNGVDSISHEAGQNRISGVVAGQEYIYSVWVSGNNLQGIGGGGKPLGVVRWRDSSGAILKGSDGRHIESYVWAPYGTYGFQQLTNALQAPSKASYVDILFRTWWGNTAGESYWDDVSLEPRYFTGLGSLLATYQAENASVLSGGSVQAVLSDYTGTGYYDMNTDGSVIEWNNVAGGGNRILAVRYSWEGNQQNIQLYVNGALQGTQKPMATGHRGVWATATWNVNLPSGNNRVRLKVTVKGGEKSQPMIDRLDVYSTGSGGYIVADGTTGSSGGSSGGGTTTPTNNPPTIAPIASQTVTEGQLLTVAVSASDSDSPAPLTLSQTNTLPGKPNILQDFGNGVGEINWTPSSGDAGSSPYSVTVTATDGDGARTNRTFDINVLPVSGSGGGKISVTPSSSPSVVNLTAEGSSDWVHWALDTNLDVNRKNTTPKVSDLTSVGGAVMPRGTNAITKYSWTDGMPMGSVSNTTAGLRVYNPGRGFAFTVPADTTARTLRVYVGASYGIGQFKVSLSDGSAPANTTMVDQSNGTGMRLLTVNYQAASAGQYLNVSYVLDTKTGTSGWASLEAVSLQGGDSGTSSSGGTGSTTTPPPASGSDTLSGAQLDPPKQVNLSGEGVLDWAHWGLNTADDFNHKTGSNQISNIRPVGGAAMPRGTSGSLAFSWSDGSPTATATNVKSNVRVYHALRGFEITVPADTTPRTLKVYVGAKNATGWFLAKLSDGSSSPYITQVAQPDGEGVKVLSINYQAESSGQILLIRYVLGDEPTNSGWISLEAATLQ